MYFVLLGNKTLTATTMSNTTGIATISATDGGGAGVDVTTTTADATNTIATTTTKTIMINTKTKTTTTTTTTTLQWHHNGLDSVSNHQPHDCLLKRLFKRRSKKTSKVKKTSLVFVRGIHRRPMSSPHKGPVTRKMFPFDDVIMITPTSLSYTYSVKCRVLSKLQPITSRLRLMNWWQLCHIGICSPHTNSRQCNLLASIIIPRAMQNVNFIALLCQRNSFWYHIYINYR